MDERLLIFTKNPILGTAKTRIGKVKGDVVALDIYRRLLKYTRDLVISLDVKKIVFFNQFIEEDGIWSDKSFGRKLQVEGDLGMKMSTAIMNEFSEGAQKVIIIGSDCADLCENDITRAFEQLDSHQVVIGPAVDGGYYLLGMDRYYPELFKNKPWSAENLLEETIAELENNKLGFYLLDEKSDIDYWEDWLKLGWD